LHGSSNVVYAIVSSLVNSVVACNLGTIGVNFCWTNKTYSGDFFSEL